MKSSMAMYQCCLFVGLMALASCAPRISDEYFDDTIPQIHGEIEQITNAPYFQYDEDLDTQIARGLSKKDRTDVTDSRKSILDQKEFMEQFYDYGSSPDFPPDDQIADKLNKHIASQYAKTTDAPAPQTTTVDMDKLINEIFGKPNAPHTQTSHIDLRGRIAPVLDMVNKTNDTTNPDIEGIFGELINNAAPAPKISNDNLDVKMNNITKPNAFTADTTQNSLDDLDVMIENIFGKSSKTTEVPVMETPTNVSCITHNGQVGVCVSYHLCDSDSKLITDGRHIIDKRSLRGECPSYMDLCCNDGDVISLASRSNMVERSGCGWRNPDGIGGLAEGSKGRARYAEFPWMTAILKLEPLDLVTGRALNIYMGGGSLIHPSAVLTAAHILPERRVIMVRAGEWDTETTKEIYPHQDREVSSIVIHNKYNEDNLFNDIAILFLSRPMDLAPNVGVACLPPPRVLVPGGVSCVTSGWGTDKFGKDGRFQTILTKVEVPAVARRRCQADLRKTRLGPYFQLHESFMCAGGETGRDACRGDGGSPLACSIEAQPGRYVQSGIVSWGIGCGALGAPGVYVDVSHMRGWIDNKMAAKGLNIKVYSDY